MAINTVKATINGTQYDLTYNSTSGKWEATLIAPAGSSFNLPGGYYPIQLNVTDTAGNETVANASTPTIGEQLRLVVKEKQPPVITIVSPTAAAYLINNKPTITFQLRDNTIGNNGDSGVKLTTLQLKIDGGSAIGSTATGMTCTPTTGGYDCTYVVQTALSDGSHTVTIDVQDNDGNSATQKSVTFTVDTVAPTLNVTSPIEGLETNVNLLTVTGTTNDATSSPVTITITLNGADQGAVTVSGTGAFSKDITLVEGTNTVIITATDSAGKTTSVTRTVALNTSAPVITLVELVPNPVDAGQTYIIKVTVQ